VSWFSNPVLRVWRQKSNHQGAACLVWRLDVMFHILMHMLTSVQLSQSMFPRNGSHGTKKMTLGANLRIRVAIQTDRLRGGQEEWGTLISVKSQGADSTDSSNVGAGAGADVLLAERTTTTHGGPDSGE
jgi:hypothetical protein